MLSNQQEEGNSMEYKNTKTGVTFSSPCAISGGDWVPYNSKLAKKEIKVQPTEEPTTISDDAKTNQVEENAAGKVPDGVTKEQIMKELDAFGIKYDKRLGEQKLYELMMQQGE